MNKEKLLGRLNSVIDEAHKWLVNCTHVVLTLGTAWVYRDLDSNLIVANCHKVPQKRFTKELLTVQEIQKNLQSILSLVRGLNPEIKCIFTVSPVRHIKDGFVQNNVSKSHLIAAVYETIFAFSDAANYFPSYEILMDELRDYRFYAQDMIHPNSLAVDYIWERFVETYVDSDSWPLMRDVDAVQKALAHRPFNPDSESHLRFLESVKNKISVIQNENPNIVF